MNGRRTIETDLSDITPSALKAYADRAGWQDVESYGDVGRIYVLNQDTPNIIIPNSMDLADYNSVLHRVIEIMSDAEDRDWNAVARDLIFANANQVRIRLVDAYDDGSISAQAGVVLIQQSWNMIVAAARSARSPQPVFKGGLPDEIREYLETVRLGQTERGSFVVNLLLPASTTSDTASNRVESFPDKVIRKLVSGLEATRETLSYDNEYHIGGMFEEYIHRGMSANLCEVVAGILAKGGDAGFDVSVKWAISSYANGDKTSIAFDKSHARLLKGVTKILRNKTNSEPFE